MTQPGFDPETLERFLDDIEGINVPVLLGIWPLASYRNAEFLNNEVPGIHIPKEIMEKMRAAGKGEKAREQGIEIAAQMIEAFRDRVQGIYIMPPFGRLELALRLLERVGLLGQD